MNGDVPHRVLLAVALWLSAGCRHGTAAADTGTSSFAFVQPPPAAASRAVAEEPKEPTSIEHYREARPVRPLATPAYPPAALAGKAGQVTIGVKITVDATGRVADIGPSLLAVTLPGRFDAEFQEAVRAAVAQWRFRPAETFRLENVPLPGGGSYQRMIDHRNVETSFDLSFTFTATGAVPGGGAAK